MLKKKYLKSKPKCKVTFRLEKSYVDGASSVDIVGDFNNWDENATPMKKLKNGDFKYEANLDIDTEYQFRYKVNKDYWVNDDQADNYSPSPYPGIDNSVVSL